MGREAACEARVGQEAGQVKALLESKVLIPRGALRRRDAVAALHGVPVVDGWLHCSAGDAAVALALGPTQAASWARKIATPPPNLAAKLGIGASQPAFVVGALDDTELAAALDGALATHAAGHADSKSTAVSARRTATRHARR